MEGKEKRIVEEGESSMRQYKWTARISRRSLLVEWLHRMDDLELEGPPPPDEVPSLVTQTNPPSGQPSLEAAQAGEPLREDTGGQGLKSELDPVGGDLPLPQYDQLLEEMDWMEEFNKNTLESQKAPPQPERSADSDPLQYLQEPAEEDNQMEDSEEDPEERPQNANPAIELNRENPAEPGGEPAGAEVEAEGDEDEENENEEENDDGEGNEGEENEDAEENDEADDDEEDDDGNEDDNEEEDEEGEASDEDVGTVSPTSTITTV